MKTAIANWFFGRGVNKLSELTSKGVRHVMGIWGGVLIGSELATQQQVDSIEGGLLAGGSIVWSIVRIWGPKLIARFFL